jgi:hypothetical protein
MAEWSDDLERAKAGAREAREAANRLRDEARELERKVREQARGARHGARGPHAHWGPEADAEGRGGGEPTSSAGARSEQSFSIEGVRNFSVDQTAGNLTVRMCTPEETPGVVTTSAKGPPQLEVRREGDRLVVEVPMAKGWLFRRKQGPTTVVRLWPGLSNVRVNVGYGEAQIRDVACETLKLDVGAGTITGYATAGDVHADVGAGKLTLNAHRGLASCATGTGDVMLDIAEVVPGDYKVDVGMGRAEVRLPAGAAIHVKAASGIGKARNEYPGGPESSPSRLKLNTGIGEVIVKTRSEATAEPRPAGTAKPQRPSRPGTVRRFEAEELRVLQMLEQGRISSQDAADLIAALQGAAPPVTGEEEPTA